MLPVEPATVHIHLWNPLKISISLSEVMLGCKFSDSELPSDMEDSEYSQDMVYGTHDKESGMYAFESFELEKLEELVLEPQERRSVSDTIDGLKYTTKYYILTTHIVFRLLSRLCLGRKDLCGSWVSTIRLTTLYIRSTSLRREAGD